MSKFRIIQILFSFGLMLALLPSCEKTDPVVRDDYLGTYELEEDCDDVVYSFEIEITADPDDTDKIKMYNLVDTGLTFTGVVNGDKVDIPAVVAGELELSGSGTLNGNKLTLDYIYILKGYDIYNCTAKGSKK